MIIACCGGGNLILYVKKLRLVPTSASSLVIPIVAQSLIAPPRLLPIYPPLPLASYPSNPDNYSHTPSKFSPDTPSKWITQTGSGPPLAITPYAHTATTTNDSPSSMPFKNAMGFGTFTWRSLDNMTSLTSYPLRTVLTASVHSSTVPNVFSIPSHHATTPLTDDQDVCPLGRRRFPPDTINLVTRLGLSNLLVPFSFYMDNLH